MCWSRNLLQLNCYNRLYSKHFLSIWGLVIYCHLLPYLSFSGPCGKRVTAGHAEGEHGEEMETLCATPGPDRGGNRNHRTRLLPRRLTRDGAPDVGILEKKAGIFELYNWEALPSSSRKYKSRCHSENTGLVRFFWVVFALFV